MKELKVYGKKLLATALAGVMALSLCACDEEDWDDEGWEDEPTETSTDDTGAVRAANVNAMQMSVNKDTGEMSISRPQLSGEAMGAEGTWTIFVYLCGSDLESDGGAGFADIEEMCSAKYSDSVKFVVQTGGASQWSYDEINPNMTQRFVVENGNITNVYEGSDANMGDPNTLAEFLTWGVQNYAADNMGLILWNHGGGSITGVCFDEKNDSDSLSLREVDSALLTAQQYMTEKWEFVGFDACLMGSVEAANILANYAKYMYGSEEVEPGAGWNYTEIGNFLAGNPSASGAELGQVVCDSFYQGCIDAGDYDCCTLAVTDLSKIDQVMQSFNSFAKDIYDAGGDADSLSTMIRNIESAENFGSNNDNEGYTNMVDLVALAESCGSYSSNADAVRSAVESAIVYKIHGSDHPDACGLSVYFPIKLGGSQELQIFSDICVSPFYMSFIERRDFSASIYYSDEGSQTADQESNYYQDASSGVSYFVEDGENYCYDQSSGTYYHYNANTEEWEEVSDSNLDADQYEYCSSDQTCSGYSDDSYYDDEGCWNWNCDYDYDQSSGCYRSIPNQTNQYSYADNFEPTGESKHIKFLREPSLDDEGIFRFTLTKYSLDHCADVYAMVYMVLSDDEVLLLGDTYDVECDWENGKFADMFDGYWISLPDGQNLSMTIVDKNEDFVIYTSPILLNGEETNLRIHQSLEDGSITVIGTWDGIDGNGAASRDFTKLKDGDKIVPLYTSYMLDDDFTEGLYEGEEFVVSGDLELDYALMYEGDFMYAFVIEDVYRDYMLTDLTVFGVDENGDVYFYVEE